MTVTVAVTLVPVTSREFRLIPVNSPKAGSAQKEDDTFHGPTLAAGGVLRPKSEAVGIKHKWRAYSAGAPDACPSTRHMAGPDDG